MKAIISGSRDWTDYATIVGALRARGVTAIVEGGAMGADRLARRAAEALSIPCTTVPADWGRYGLAAGRWRNQAMIDGHPDARVLLAFPLPQSKGTYDTMHRALRAGLLVFVYGPGDVDGRPWFGH